MTRTPPRAARKQRKPKTSAEFLERHYPGHATEFPAYGPHMIKVPRWVIGRIVTEAFDSGFEAGKRARPKRRKAGRG